MFVVKLLRPEKKVMETNHENIIRSLNEYMAKKAEVQIKLNETRDTLRETNSIVRIFLIKKLSGSIHPQASRVFWHYNARKYAQKSKKMPQ